MRESNKTIYEHDFPVLDKTWKITVFEQQWVDDEGNRKEHSGVQVRVRLDAPEGGGTELIGGYAVEPNYVAQRAARLANQPKPYKPKKSDERIRVHKCLECQELSEDWGEGRVYECNGCGQKLIDERRCDQCHRFAARVADEYCPNCEDHEAGYEMVLAVKDPRTTGRNGIGTYGQLIEVSS